MILIIVSFPFFTELDKVGTLDAILSGAYCRSQMYLSRQMARLRPELTMSMFSGKFDFVLFNFNIVEFLFLLGDSSIKVDQNIAPYVH